MKRVLLFFLILTSVSISCIPKYQVFTTKQINKPENDVVTITYNFWTNKGVVYFTIFNNLDKPVYIDWKKSSFILNGKKFDYWTDEESSIINSKAKSSNFTYYNTTKQQATITSVKPEQVTFIPPQSYCEQARFNILESRYVFAQHVNHIDFTSANSPLIFRNYICVSLSENSEDPVFIESSFYVNSVSLVKETEFRKRIEDPNEKMGYNYVMPYKEKSSFYFR